MVSIRNVFLIVACLALGTLVGCGKEKASGDTKGSTEVGTITNTPGSTQKTTEGFCTDALQTGAVEMATKMQDLSRQAQEAGTNGDLNTARAKMQEAADACTNFASRFQSGFECKVKDNGNTFKINDVKTGCTNLQSEIDKL